MKRPLFLCLLAFALTGFALTEEIEKTIPAQTLDRVRVENVNGDVEVKCVSGDDVRLKAVKKGKTQEALDEMKISIKEEGRTLTVTTEYPHHGLLGLGHSHGGSVQYTLDVPERLAVDVDTVNGGVRVTGGRAGVALESVNGEVRAEGIRGRITAETVNGGINVESLDEMPDLHFETVNGAIVIKVPRAVRAAYHFETVNGTVRSAPENFTVNGSGPKEIDGTWNDGGGKIHAETVNGGITVELI